MKTFDIYNDDERDDLHAIVFKRLPDITCYFDDSSLYKVNEELIKHNKLLCRLKVDYVNKLAMRTRLNQLIDSRTINYIFFNCKEGYNKSYIASSFIGYADDNAEDYLTDEETLELINWLVDEYSGNHEED